MGKTKEEIKAGEEKKILKKIDGVSQEVISYFERCQGVSEVLDDKNYSKIYTNLSQISMLEFAKVISKHAHISAVKLLYDMNERLDYSTDFTLVEVKSVIRHIEDGLRRNEKEL